MIRSRRRQQGGRKERQIILYNGESHHVSVYGIVKPHGQRKHCGVVKTAFGRLRVKHLSGRRWEVIEEYAW